MLQAPVSGVISGINLEAKKRLDLWDGVIEVVISKQEGGSVTSVLKDNSDFIGYVVCKAKTVDELRSLLGSVEQEATSLVSISYN